jgi:NADP-dependent 3-hydroxy acid dehydrogenase YdfG
MRESLLGVTGARTSVVKALATILPPGVELVNLADAKLAGEIPRRVVLADGLIYQKPLAEQTAEEVQRSLDVNLVSIIRITNWLLDADPEARVVIIGSQSAVAGSFDETYAAAKAGIHAFVKWRTTRMNQQLVCVSPPLISDSYWCSQRHDYPECLERRPHCTALDVARVVKSILFNRGPEFTNLICTVAPTGGPGIAA